MRSTLFKDLLSQYISGKLVPDNAVFTCPIAAPNDHDITDIQALTPQGKQDALAAGQAALTRGEVGAIIATGGMATRFHYEQPKALFPILGEETFLSLKIKDYKQHGIPVFLMVSFATEQMIREYLEEQRWFDYADHITLFSQFSFPRITKEGVPCADEAASGHGDVFEAFMQDGLLDNFITQGGKYLLFSNIDNLGSVIKTGGEVILGLHIIGGKEMTIEVARKNPGDKGGAPALVNGQLQLVEGFLFPKEFDQDSITVFNTATYIFNAASMQMGKVLPWYAVAKERDGEEVIQFERLAGDISGLISNQAILVNREQRFFPIKKQEDVKTIMPKLEKLFQSTL